MRSVVGQKVCCTVLYVSFSPPALIKLLHEVYASRFLSLLSFSHLIPSDKQHADACFSDDQVVLTSVMTECRAGELKQDTRCGGSETGIPMLSALILGMDEKEEGMVAEDGES